MSKRIIISGGGTGGHIFPAISIANTLKEKMPDVQILFVGAEGRMEMEKVPAAGYEIIGLPIAGFQRRFTLQNITFFFKLFSSLRKAKKIVKEFKPDAAVGVGGYASGPTLKVATKLGVPTLIQEQNSYAGVTNKLLAKNAKCICVAYEGMEHFFPENKIKLTGNPIRKELLGYIDREVAFKHYSIPEGKKCLLIIGGSLGARTINEALLNDIDLLIQNNIEIIWQTGKTYFDAIQEKVSQLNAPNIHVHAFLSRMDLAYRAANVVISRAGASSISELCVVGKAAILVPSPNVSEDHQTQNALALVQNGAAIMVRDNEAHKKLVPRSLELLQDSEKCSLIAQKAKKMAFNNASEAIVDELIKILK